MKTKFSKKLLALFLAVLMALSSFTGVLTVFGAESDPDFHDDNIVANALGWVELQDEQTLGALLDYLDGVLAGADLDVTLYYKITGDLTIDLRGHIDSISGLLAIIDYFNDWVSNNYTTLSFAGVGIHKQLDLSPIGNLSYNNNTNESKCGRAYREVNSAKSILTALLKMLYGLASARSNADPVLKQLLTGNLDLGGIVGAALDVWSLINDGLLKGIFVGGLKSGYQNDLVVNVVTRCLTDFTDWYTEDEKTHMINGDAGYELDVMLFKALQDSLLKEINIEITYPDGTSSRTRYAEGNTDPHLFYTTDGNVYLFRYDDNADGVDDANITINPQTNLFDFSYDALKVAWKTALAPTLGLINSAVKDYDWNYNLYVIKNYGWDYDNVANNYTEAKVQAWAAADGLDLDAVKADLTYNRDIIENPNYNWRDIDSTRLFNELRRSPLMVYYFKAPTGPLNTNFKCTGTPNIDKFMAEKLGDYTSIPAAFNDFLCAAVQDFMPEYDGGFNYCNTVDPLTIATTLIGNACKVFQFAADATDKNILSSFYHTYGASAVLSEENFEEAMVPFLISCLENNIPDLDHVHKDKWDACNDAEGVAAVAFEEYLSFILPDRDYSSLIRKDAEGFYDVTLEDLLAMARDAVGYVMMQYVPVTDKAGNDWIIYNEGSTVTTYEQQVAAGTDLLSLLNSVIYYYGTHRGVAQLLGFVDKSGNSLITRENSIWQNIDIAANKLLPVLGELQYGDSSKHGQFNSEALIWDDVVSGILDIGDSSIHESNVGGITNFFYRFLTIICSPSIQSKGIVMVAYDFIKDFANGLFGARYTNQGYTTIIPDVTGEATNYPFHNLIKVNNLAGVKKTYSDIGVIGKFFVNVIEFTGYGSYPDTVWPAVSFLIQSVNSFIPAFCPTLSNYNVGRAQASLDKTSITGYSAGNAIQSTMSVKNLGEGINRYIVNANGTSTQLSRSYIKVNSVTTDKNNINVASNANLIAPGDTASFAITGNVTEAELGSSNECIVTYTVHYDIVEKNGTVLYGNQTTEIYQYFSAAPDWESLTYSDTTASGFTMDYSPRSAAQIGTYTSMSGELWSTGILSGKRYCGLQFPSNVVIKTSKLDAIDNITVYLNNETKDRKSIDAITASDANYGGTDYFAVTCDPVTGALTNTFFYDYYQYDYTVETVTGEDGTTYEIKHIVYDENGTPTGKWVTNDPKSRADVLNLVETDQTVGDYRFHQICAYNDITSHFSGTSVIPKMSEDGSKYECVYLKQAGNNDTGYKTWIDYSKTDPNDVTLSSGIAGVVLAFNKVEGFANQSAQKFSFLAWDQETQVVPSSADITFSIICSNIKTFDINISVCDDSEAADIRSTYATGIQMIDDYNPANFSDYNGSTSATYDYFKQTLKDALKAESTAVVKDNAGTLGSDKAYFARTVTTTDMVGDQAFKPATADTMNSSAFASLKNETFENGGVWYQTRYTDVNNQVVYANPVYSNVALTDADVTSTGTVTIGDASYPTGVDALGNAVVKIKVNGEDDAAVWHLLNAVKYKDEWVDLSANGTALFSNPYKQTSTTPEMDASGKNALYTETSFVYRNANGIKCKSTDKWVVKIAETNYTIIPGDPSYRGVYAVANDKLQYAYEYAISMINVNDAATLYTDVAKVRAGLDNVNFNVITYEAMAAMGREAESLFTADLYNDYYYRDYTDETTTEPQLLFSCYASEAAEKLAAYNAANHDDIVMAALQVKESETVAPKIESKSTTFELLEAKRLFNLYLAAVEERGYIGDKLEEEISCAVNGKSCENRDDKSTPYTSVTVDAANASYTVSGTTYTADSNPDGVTYTADSWAAFIAALDAAVDAANLSASYPYAQKGLYNAADKESYTLQVTNVYNTRKALMLAENGLTEVENEPVPDGYTVSAFVGALAAPEDAYGTYATTGAEVSITLNDGTVVSAVTGDDGKFVLENVPNGTYTATITYKYGLTRTFTIIVNGANVESTTMVGIVACNWDGNTSINSGDYSLYAKMVGVTVTSPNYDVGYNIDRNTAINTGDYSIYAKFVGKTVANMTYTDTVIQ